MKILGSLDDLAVLALSPGHPHSNHQYKYVRFIHNYTHTSVHRGESLDSGMNRISGSMPLSPSSSTANVVPNCSTLKSVCPQHGTTLRGESV